MGEDYLRRVAPDGSAMERQLEQEAEKQAEAIKNATADYELENKGPGPVERPDVDPYGVK